MIPSGISLVVNSSSAKLDMEALTASLPKYKCLEEMYKAWWLSFLEQLNGSFNARRERNMDIVRRVKEHIPTSAIKHHKIQLVILRKKSKHLIRYL